MSHDVRSIANFVLDLAERDERDVSNLVINKVVFFLHAHYLVYYDKPLVSAKIEAWDLGPVFRELYREFKEYDKRPIKKRARRLNPESGCYEICRYTLDSDEKAFLESVAKKYVRLTPSALVALSHEKGGPWDQVWNHATLTNASMSITDDVIRNWYAKAARH
jgi:uncharacterized phage-associated protein